MLGRTGGSARLRGALIQVCALRDVSPRDRRLCVLPGWQMNVNVNGKTKNSVSRFTVNKKAQNSWLFAPPVSRFTDTVNKKAQNSFHC